MTSSLPLGLRSRGISAKIGLDCRLAGKRNAGIGRYILNLAQRLPLESKTSHLKFVYFIYDNLQQTEIDPLGKLPVTWVLSPYKHYSFSEQVQFVLQLLRQDLDLLHVPHFNVPLVYFKKTVVTIHDLLWHEYKGLNVTTLPAWQYWLKYFMYRLTVFITTKKAKNILVPSMDVKKTILKYFPDLHNKITITYEGCSNTLNKNKNKKNNQLDLKQLLYIGSLYPHKNVSIILDALLELPNYKLIIAGARNAFSEQIVKRIRENDLSSRVFIKGYIPDSELSDLINSSLAVIQPSLSEGFGLTGLEAMGSGGVVISSDIPVFREIYGKAAEFFDPHDKYSLIKAIKNLSIEKRSKLQTAGKTQVSKFDWNKTTAETIKVYNLVLSS